jgi:phage terminase large subunit-like protein
VAAALGTPFLDWQSMVVARALEHENGRLAYRDVSVSLPRQQGKSVIAQAVALHRMISAPNQRVVYAAQSRLKARERLFDLWWPRIRRSPLAGMFTLSRATGAESLRCSNGSILTLLSTEESSSHGDTLDLAILDETWAVDEAAEQSVKPAMITRSNAQAWCLSAAGTVKSVFWRGKVDSGRTSAELGVTEGSFYVEWSAPDDADPTDPATWWASMPSLGALIEESTVAADLATIKPLSMFRRSHLNQWGDEVADSGWAVISRDAWMAARL